MIEVDEETKLLLDAMWVANYAQRCVAKVLKPFGLTPARLNYLMVIQQTGWPEGISQQEIGKRLLIDKSNVTNDVDFLEGKWWVVRTRGIRDLRWRLVKMTPQGDQLLGQVRPVHEEVIQQLTGGIPERFRRELAEILKEWRDALEGPQRWRPGT